MQAVILGWIVLLSAFAGNVNCLNVSSLAGNFSGVSAMAVETVFQFPSALPKWPPGKGFGAGEIDLGGLIVAEVSNFTKIWAAQEGGPDGSGAAIFEPTAVPDGFHVLGHYGQPNNVPLFGENTGIEQDSAAYIWLPVPADGYNAVGHVVTTSPEKPPLDKIRCVRVDFTDVLENDDWIWGSNGLNIYSSRPKDRGTKFSGVNAGTFIAQLSDNGTSSSVACLKNLNPKNTSAMPNLSQIDALIQTYSPWIYFHPDDEFLPSSVDWFFENGALLYTKGQESSPVTVQPGGENLPQGGDNDGAYWLDLPLTDPDRVKQGNLQNSTFYIHVKPMFGATFTDLAARAKVSLFTLKLGKIGEHVGDWEHVTLRISNFNGELKRVYFSKHSKGEWLSAAAVELQGGNKPVVYSSLHSHAMYPTPGLVLLGGEDIGIRDDTERGDVYIDTAASFSVVSAEYLGSAVVEPPWLNFAREWGPKIEYDFEKELEKVERFLPGKLKEDLENIIKNIPSEVLGEEGPTGPKGKDNWSGDEDY
nr:uncharacterized protein LOC109186445 [Ipomoea batatas]